MQLFTKGHERSFIETQIDAHTSPAAVLKNQRHYFRSQILDSDWLILDGEIQQYSSFRILHNHQKSLQCDLIRNPFAKDKSFWTALNNPYGERSISWMDLSAGRSRTPGP